MGTETPRQAPTTKPVSTRRGDTTYAPTRPPAKITPRAPRASYAWEGLGSCLFTLAQELGQVNGVALGVLDHCGLQNLSQSLGTANLADQCASLAGAVQHLCELVRVHTVLGAHGDDVVNHLSLVNGHFQGVGEGVQNHLVLEGGLGVLANLSAVLLGVVAGLSVGVVEVLLQLILDNLLGNGDLNQLNELGQDLVACLDALLGNLGLGNLLLDVFLQLFDGVELGSQLCELVVSLGQLALLDSGQLDLDDGFFAGVLAAGELGLEGCVLASGQAGQGLVMPSSMVPEPIW